MKGVYRTILSSILSEHEIKEIDDIDNACKNDIEVYKLLCASGAFLFADWSEGAYYFDKFSSFVSFRLKNFAKLHIKDFDKSAFFELLNDRKSKGDKMLLLLKHFKKHIETKELVFMNLDFLDDTYRICMTNALCAKYLSEIEFMEGKFVVL